MNFDPERPIFLQIAQSMEDAILTGAFAEETQIPSITEVSVSYKINPATALKGVNMLVESGVVYKKRGVGMFVAAGATEKLQNKRREEFYGTYIKNLLAEAKRLNLSLQDVKAMIERGYEK